MNEAARMKRDPRANSWGGGIRAGPGHHPARRAGAAEGSDGAPKATMTEESEMPDERQRLIQEIVLRLFDLAGIQGLDRVTSLKDLVTRIEQEVRADRRREYD